MKYELYSKDELLGESELEIGDPPMGVASGKLKPTSLYFQHQAVFEAHDYEKIAKLNLHITTIDGIKLQPCSGIGIVDYSKDMEEEYIEVSVLGLDSKLYTKLFPHHVKAYENQFK